MKVYTLKFEQKILINIEEMWNFFSNPLNIRKITPEKMNFSITTEYDESKKMYPGLIIGYKVSPLFNIRMNWVTEITHVKEYEYFIDEQRFGPYKFWHHQHHFERIPEGVLMKDIVTYGLPFGLIGQLANAFFVENEIKKIFDYRREKIKELFEQS